MRTRNDLSFNDLHKFPCFISLENMVWIKIYLVKIDYIFFFKKLSIQHFFLGTVISHFSHYFPTQYDSIKMLCQWNHSFFNLIQFFKFLYLLLIYATLHYWPDLAYQLWQSLLWLHLSLKFVSSVWISACMLLIHHQMDYFPPPHLWRGTVLPKLQKL